MSKSFRQIGQLKQAGNTMNSTQTMPAHRRNKSIQTRNFSAILERARELYLSGQMMQAVDCINRGLYYDYNNLQLNFMLGVAHLTLSSYNQALLYLEKVAKISSKYKSNLFLLISIAYKKKGDFAAALQSINTQIGLNQDAQALFYRARLYLNQSKYEKSLQDISKILLQNPHHAPALILKIKVYSTSKSYNQALEAIRIAKIMIQQIDKQQQIRLQQAYILTQTSKFQQALQCICKIQKDFIILDSGVELAKARILQKSKREQQAIVLYNEILQKSIQSRIFCEAVSQLGIYYMKERDYYEAFSYLKRTQMVKVKSKPTDNLMKLAEGLTFLMKKKYAQAILLLGSCQFQFKHSLAEHTIFLSNLSLNGLAYGSFTLGNHQQALDLYRRIDRNDESTDSIAVLYNMSICDGILLHSKGYRDQSIQTFYKAFTYIQRPQPYFYIAVIQNQDFLKSGIDTQGLSKTLDLIEKGLRAGQSAHMYYYRAVIYLFLGMNSQALEDIDRAIEKSEDNVARYFHARGIIFMLDKNYEQASSQFATALSIDENAEESAIQRAKCQLLSGDSANAYSCIQGLQREQYWRTYFQLYQKDYDGIMASECQDQSILQTCEFMRGRFEQAGPAGKLIIAIKYDNHIQVVKLIQEAATLGVSVGCLQINDLLILQAYSQYKLSRFQEAAITLTRVQRALRQSNSHTQTYCEEDERKLLFCKVNQILINLKRDHRLEALQLTEELLSQVCEGPTSDELHRLKKYLIEGGEYELGFGSETQMINDYFMQQNVNGMKFNFLIPMPHPKVHQVQDPQYENLLTEFQVKDIQNKPEAPWIKRGQYGVIFTNQIKQYQNLNLKTEENQARSRQNGSQRISTRSRLKKALELSKSIMDKLDRLAKKNREQQD